MEATLTIDMNDRIEAFEDMTEDEFADMVLRLYNDIAQGMLINLSAILNIDILEYNNYSAFGYYSSQYGTKNARYFLQVLNGQLRSVASNHVGLMASKVEIDVHYIEIKFRPFEYRQGDSDVIG